MLGIVAKKILKKIIAKCDQMFLNHETQANRGRRH